ncbi:MAG: hypothetical protein JWR88_2589 [Pseudonocardia sp.]|nr:hypothetical protein [Pseudonocardia sp.]
MRRASLGALRVLAAGTTLALGCFAIVSSAEIVAFFATHAMWIMAGLAVLTALVVVGLALGPLLRKPGRQQHAAPAAPVEPAGG